MAMTCQRSPEPVFLKWKGMRGSLDSDFAVPPQVS